MIEEPPAVSNGSSSVATVPSSSDVDRLFDAFADRRRRATLDYLATHEVASFEELVTALVTVTADDTSDREDVEASLHHVHLPKLADVGLVSVDAEGDVIRLGPLFEDVRALLDTA